jgi:hypothetical protein
MKRLLLLSSAIFYFSFIFAQTETKLFTGDTTPSSFSSIDMCGWAAPGNYLNFGTTDAPTYTEVTDNPDKTGLDATTKVIHLTSLQGHSWWGDFLYLTLTSPVTITAENRYLHFYHYRQNLNFGFSVNINKNSTWDGPDIGTKRFDLNLSSAGKWEDVVIDLKWFLDNNEPLSMITVLMDINWNGAAEPVTDYYFDEIVLNNNNMPRGINILPDTDMSLFYGNTTSYLKWVKTLDVQNIANTSSIINNPFTTQTSVLNSTKVLQFTKSADAAWWQGVRTVLPGVIQVGLNGESYLHVMVNIPTMDPTKDYYVVQLNVKDFAGNQLDSGDNLKYWSTDAGNWVDMVLDVTSLSYIQEFTVRFDVRWDAKDANINSPAGTFYMDAAAIDGNIDPRLVVTAPTGVNNPKTSGLKIYSVHHNIVVEGNVASIEVFNLIGKSVSKITGNQYKSEIPVTNSGVYLVRTVSPVGIIYNSKLVVK